jgi:hypothetical protein
MRAVFAIAPLALMLAWLNPHSGPRSAGLAGSPLSSWSVGDASASDPTEPTRRDASALLAYRFDADRPSDAAPQSAKARTGTTPGNLLLNAAVVR